MDTVKRETNRKAARIAATELNNESNQGREQLLKVRNVENTKPHDYAQRKLRQQMIADWQSRQQMTDALALQLWHENNPPK